MAEIKFDQALERLEKIVEEMEGEELPLETSLKKYEEGVRLAQLCLKKLEETEQKIEIMTRTVDDRLLTRPFEVEGKGRETSEGELPLE